MTAADINFIRAELALTKNTGEQAKALFEAGMRSSFAKINLVAGLAGAPKMSEETITAYVNKVLALYDAGDANKKLELVLTQKWIHDFGNGTEAYNDIRRTGFPQICDPAKDPNEFSIQSRPYPVSLLYNSDDLTTNPNATQRNQYTDKIFWDVD